MDPLVTIVINHCFSLALSLQTMNQSFSKVSIDWSWFGLKEALGIMSTEDDTLADALVNISGHQQKYWSIC
jgi:hypothetical protein